MGALSGYDTAPLSTEADRGGGPFQEITGGLHARRTGRRVDLRLDYGFGLRHYTGNSRLDRSNQSFNLEMRLLLSRRWTLMLRDAATSSSFGESLQAPAPNLSAGFYADPGPDVFHSRTIANTGLADLIY